ncbi:MAG: DUF1361 domain-containing protein [Bacteroidota bacterium]
MQFNYLFATALSLGASITLAAFRFHWSGEFTYLFLIWNLFLAFIPFVISTAILHSNRLKNSKLLFILAALLWLLFLPNAPYIITDIKHLRPKSGIPIWYDIFVVFSFAWNGLLLAYLSLSDMRKMVQKLFGKWQSNLFAGTSLVACSFGIYLGRYLRWNSWDAFTQPKLVAYETYSTFTQPFQESQAWGIVLVMAVFLLLTYPIFELLRIRG